MGDNGEEKLLAVARHIAKTLGRDDSMTDDILHIFSKFDGRFSRDKFSSSSSDPDPSRVYAPPLDPTLHSLDRQISHYLSSDHPIWSDSADSSAFLDAVDELLATLRDWAPAAAADKAVFASLSRADELMQLAMFRLRDEFRTLMETGSDSVDLGLPYARRGDHPTLDSEEEEEEEEDVDVEELEGVDDHIPVARPVTDYDIIIDALPSGTINDLHEIARRMVAAGFGQECASVYSSCRREFLEESMSRLGLQKLSIEEAQKMSWQDLEDEIERWIKATNVAVRILFPSERRLCDRVFSGLSSAADFSFMEVCRGSMVQLLNFADAVSIGSRSPERLFKVLDVFETLRDLMPELDALFSDQFCLLLRNEAITIWKRLGDVVRGILMELENLIRRDPAKAAVPGGGLHPITRYVMNYLRAACRSRQALEQVFEESIVSPNEYAKLDGRAATSSLSVQMAWIMDLLESNLEAKSKVYREAALCSVFMMNNAKYIVQKVRDSDLGTLLGEDWIRKQTGKVRQYQQNYIRSSWNKVVGVLKLDSSSQAPRFDAASMKEKLKLFNAAFEDMCKVQSSWIFTDEQLREDLRISVIKLVVPFYQACVSRLQNVGEMRKQSTVKGVEEIEVRIGELFVGRSSESAGGRV
ncbi:exocyst complex component EXO70B1 [Punica granatum]|uniref:Exocyst subunit Exo70 family protein n=2 Tax=Punica granatum TaxID=22663 RepID=A0A218W8A4_PUNGR|nr:exocyst complex component EXO70B1 [Punica granatum]OWM68708.1 hypothetical protein CDL15_Pgr024895 [Punica granatum]PKI58458.1 hypothetical protein CRG98_021143 [Punica granatum]